MKQLNGDLHLPDELLDEIVLRSPLKSLFRFKSVSKRLKSLISDPKFHTAYANRHPEASPRFLPALLYRFTDSSHRPCLSTNVKPLPALIASATQSDELSLNLASVALSDDENHQILVSSKGLILSVLLPFLDMKRLAWRIVLCVSNPLTRHSVHLPKTTLLDSPALVIGFVAKQTSQSTALQYKVVLIRQFTYELDPEECAEASVETFSSDTGVWAASTLRCTGEVLNRRAEQCFAYKGALHWLGKHTRGIITYDPYDKPHRFGRIELPGPVYNYPTNACLIYSGEEEVLKCCEIGDDRFWVWRLVDYGEGEWCLEDNFPVPNLFLFDTRKLVAPNPWNREAICGPYAEVDDSVTVVHPQTGIYELVSVLEMKTPKGPMPFDFCCDSHKDPLIPIELSPWSSPFYNQAS